MKHLLFQKVNCKSYLKRKYDGRFIESYKNENGKRIYDYIYMDTNNPDLDIECECCGELDFLKIYYEHREKEFSGIIVGFKDIVATGYLTVDTDYHYDGTEYKRLGKQPKDVIECGIVYFGNNRKRYVPIDSIETL